MQGSWNQPLPAENTKGQLYLVYNVLSGLKKKKKQQLCTERERGRKGERKEEMNKWKEGRKDATCLPFI